MKWERKHAYAAGGVLLVGALLFYSQRNKTDGLTDAGTSPPGLDPGPAAKAPENLLAEVYVSSPNATWTKIQRGIGGALGILPMTLPGVVVALADLDVMLAGELDGTSPIHAALAGDPADPEWAIAMKLVDGRRARGVLIDGDTSRFSGKEAAGMTILVPKRVASPGEKERAVAITSNGWLLVTRDEKGLGPLSGYVTRTLATQPPPTLTNAAVIDVPRSALATSLGPKLKQLWQNAKDYLGDEDKRMRAEHSGRAPDFGDPAAIVAALDGLATRRIAIVSDFDKVRITFDVSEDAITAHATLTPPKAGAENAARAWVDAMTVGDSKPILSLPSTAGIAISMRDSESARKEQAESLKTTLASVLGPRLKDPAPLHKVIEDATKARKDVVTIALALDDPSGNFLRVPINDPQVAESAANGAVDLAKVDPFKEMLRAKSFTSRKEPMTASGDAHANVTMFTHPKPDAGPPRRDSGVAWMLYEKNGELVAGFGAEPAATLRAGLNDKNLSAVPALKHFLDAIGEDASTIVIAQPLKMDARRSALPAAPAQLAIGKKDGAAFLHLEVPDVLLREFSRRQFGL